MIEIDCDTTGIGPLVLRYEIDRAKGTLSLPLDALGGGTQAQRSVVALMAAAILAKLALAQDVVIKFPVPEGIVGAFSRLLDLLYVARSYRDRRSDVAIPNLIAPNVIGETLMGISPTLDRKRAVVLLSGGKDSAAALLAMRSNGYDVLPLHIRINAAASAGEQAAVERLDKIFGTRSKVVEVPSEGFAVIGAQFSHTFNRYPRYNAIPHGRDFLLAALAAVYATSVGAASVAVGVEYDLFSRTIAWAGRTVHCHDAQSAEGLRIIDEIVSKYCGGTRVFSPIAPLTEFRIFRALATRFPHVLDSIESCFWGGWCGECFKCFRYALLARVLNVSTLKFAHDPMASVVFASEYISHLGDRSLAFSQSIEYCLIRLLQSDDTSAVGSFLRQHPPLTPTAADAYAQAILESYLICTHAVGGLPDDFDPARIEY